MRFLLSFTTGADVEFEIPEADLKRQPETTLSVMSRPRWTGPEGAPEVQRLEAPGTAETSWSDGMGAFVVAWYARTGGNQALELPAPVELEDAVAIADWLLLPLGDLSQITYAAGADIHRDARPAHAFIYRSRARGRPKACNADQIKAAATSPRPGARVVVGGRDARARLVSSQSLDAISGITTATAWAVIVFASTAPDGHWLQVPSLRVGASPKLRQRADLTFGIYCLHWPILMLCLRAARARGLAESAVAAFVQIFVPTILGAIACATMYDAALAKLAPSNRVLTTTQSAAAKRFPAIRRSSSVLSGWGSE